MNGGMATHVMIENNLFVTFYQWDEKTYCLELDGSIVLTSQSSRRFLFSSILNAAEKDLAELPNGKWCFSQKTGWVNIPLSAIELIYLPGGTDLITLKTILQPITNINKYLFENILSNKKLNIKNGDRKLRKD